VQLIKTHFTIAFLHLTHGKKQVTICLVARAIHGQYTLIIQAKLKQKGEIIMIAIMRDVTKKHGNNIAVNQLNLEVKQGEILGLLGPNGAGKTTTIKMLCGLTDADSGAIQILDKKQSVQNLELRKDLGLVTQEITVFNDLSAKENLEYFGSLYGLRGDVLQKNVAEMLKFVGLTDRAKDKPPTFSGGMQRRLNIACALVHKPKLVIMDEPTVGIDPQSRNHILEAIKKLNQSGTTVIYTSHYMEEIEAICNRIYIMDKGQVIAEGTTQHLLQQHGKENLEEVLLELTGTNLRDWEA